MTALSATWPSRSVHTSIASPIANAATIAAAWRTSMPASTGDAVAVSEPVMRTSSSRLLLAEAEALGDFHVRLRALAHERVHLVDADVDQLETVLERELLHLGLRVERAHALPIPQVC